MTFEAADYDGEAERRWGYSDEWSESQRRTEHYDDAQWDAIKDESETIETHLAGLMASGIEPQSPAAMDAADLHRRHISRWFYPCTRSMHRALGQMYVGDPRFTAHYDTKSPGLAKWLCHAIEANAERAAS